MLRTLVRVLKTPITLIALIALVGFAASWGWANTIAPIPPRALNPCVTQKLGPTLTPEHVYLRLLNGGFAGSAAKRMGVNLRSYGFKVIKINNTTGRIQTTTIVGHAVDDPEVRLVAGFFVSPVIQADARVDHTVDVLIGATFPGYAPNPPLSVPLPDGTACVPTDYDATPTDAPTASPSVTYSTIPTTTVSPTPSKSAKPKPSTTPTHK